MVSITLSVPAELKDEMEEFPDINWSAVARQAIKKKVLMLHKFKEFDIDLTSAEANELLAMSRAMSVDLKRPLFDKELMYVYMDYLEKKKNAPAVDDQDDDS